MTIRKVSTRLLVFYSAGFRIEKELSVSEVAPVRI
jgi:hypothetical protein